MGRGRKEGSGGREGGGKKEKKKERNFKRMKKRTGNENSNLKGTCFLSVRSLLSTWL